MSTKYKFYDPNGTYFVTYAVVGWVDVFTRDEYRTILIDSFNYCTHKKGPSPRCSLQLRRNIKTKSAATALRFFAFTNLAGIKIAYF